jgi:hypothetical protein
VQIAQKVQGRPKVAFAPPQVIWASIKMIPIEPPQWHPLLPESTQIRSGDSAVYFSACSLLSSPKSDLPLYGLPKGKRKCRGFVAALMPIQYSPLPLGAGFGRLVYRILQILEEGSPLLIRKMSE